jgi:hypothetical protein
MRKAGSRRRNPFRPEIGRPLIVHCSHHKAGTVWFRKVLSELRDGYGLHLQRCLGEPIEPETDIAFFRSGRLFSRALLSDRTFRGSHLIRDPRDVVVSGYFYHLWTREKWVHQTDGRTWGGLSYQAYLNSVDRHQGLLAEIEYGSASTLADMAKWDYGQPEFLELRYEDLIQNEVSSFSRLFEFYGFDERAVTVGLAGVERHSIRLKPGQLASEEDQKRHIRSGRAGQWREHFGPEHVARFKELNGDLLLRLGYESNADWTGDHPDNTRGAG